MALVNADDINEYLPADKIVWLITDPEADEELATVERIVRAYMAVRLTPAALATWTTPASTPGLIREIAARMGAGRRYRKRYSEESVDENSYSTILLREAYQMLDAIVNGELVLEDIVPGTFVSVVTQEGLRRGSFYPDSTAPAPAFRIGQAW